MLSMVCPTNFGRWRRLLPASACLFLAPLAHPAPAAASSPVRINEVMASNGDTLADMDWSYEDWIELYNAGAEPVDLSDWGLSDSVGNPFKWRFPEGTVLAGHDTLLVWASGKDRQPGEPTPGLLREVYERVFGFALVTLLESPSFPTRPSHTEVITDLFEAPRNAGDQYGQRLSGVLIAPQSGTYRFWIAADDTGALYLSPNHLPGRAVPIASVPRDTGSRQWTKYPEQESAPIELVAGQAYYIAALMKEAAQGDNLAVRWQRPDGVFEGPIPATYFHTYPGELHTNYSISAGGEAILLTAPDGSRVDTLEPTALPRGISVGRAGDDALSWYFFDEPTPGAANSTTPYLGILDGVAFSHPPGFYSDPVTLSLTAPAGTTILYTLDGSEPDPAHLGGTTYAYKNQYPREVGSAFGEFLERSVESHEYLHPLVLDDRSTEPNGISLINTRFTAAPQVPQTSIRKANVVRARAIAEGYLPSATATGTYFVDPAGGDRDDLMVLSITTDERGLFDYNSGITVAGQLADAWRQQFPGAAWLDGNKNANYHQYGEHWERPAHLEVFAGAGPAVASLPIGLRTHGGWSRATAYRKSFRIYPKSAAGSADVLDLPLFDSLQSRGANPLPIESFSRLILRNSGTDHAGTLYRDALAQELAKPMGLDHSAYRPVVHFINGEYWGINNLRERIDRFFIAAHHGVDPGDVVLLENDGVIEEGYETDRDQYLDMVAFAEAADLSDPAQYAELAALMDVDNFARYFAVQVYIANADWPQHNINYWRKRTPGFQPDAVGAHDGRWRWILYDLDFGFTSVGPGLDTLARVVRTGGASAPEWSTRLFRSLLENRGFRDRFINYLNDCAVSLYAPSRVSATVDAFNARIESSRAEHVERWSNGNDRGAQIKTFSNQRPAHVRQHILDAFELPGTAALTVATADPARGRVRLNSLVLDPATPGLPDPAAPYPWTATYFQEVPVELEALPEEGFRFVGWKVISAGAEEDGYISTEPVVALALGGDTAVEAVFEPIPPAEVPVALHAWDFESVAEFLVPSYTVGGGVLAVEPGAATEVLRNTSAQNFPTAHLRVNNPLGATVTLGIPTTGYEAITLDFLIRRSGQGAGEQTLSYTLDGVEWHDHATIAVDDAAPQAWSFDFGPVSGVADNPDFAVRFSAGLSAAQLDGGGGLGGNHRFDDILVAGVALEDADLIPILLPGGNAEWHVAANWSSGTVPNGIGQTAIVGAPAAGSRAVSLAAPVTLGTLRFQQGEAPHRNRLSSGGGSLTFDGGAQAAKLVVEGEGSGFVEFDLDSVHLATDLVIEVQPIVGDAEFGALRLRRVWSGPGGLIKQGPGLLSLTGADKSFGGAVVIEQGVLSVTEPAVPAGAASVTVQAGGQLRLVSGGTAEAPRVYTFGGGTLVLAGPGRGGEIPPGEQLGILGALRFDPGSNDQNAVLTNPLELTGAATIHVDGSRNTLVLDGAIQGGFSLAKSGGGTVVLAGSSLVSAPAVTVENGTLVVNAHHAAAVELGAQGILEGAGSVGALSGAGTVDPGTATLAAESLGAARLAAVFTAPGGGLTGNGTVALASPSAITMAPDRIDLYLNAGPLATGDRFVGGLLVDPAFDLAAALATTQVELWLADPDGEHLHGGVAYRSAAAGDLLTWAVVDHPAGRTLEVVRGGQPAGFEQWRNLLFADVEDRDDPAVTGPLASPAGDGVPNVVKYALGLGPLDPFPGDRLLPVEGAPDALTLRFFRDPGRVDIAYVVRASTDLIDWDTVVYDSRSDPAPNTEGAFMEVAHPLGSTGTVYLRLFVVLL